MSPATHDVLIVRCCVIFYVFTAISYSLPGPHDTGDIFKVMGSKVEVRQ